VEVVEAADEVDEVVAVVVEAILIAEAVVVLQAAQIEAITRDLRHVVVIETPGAAVGPMFLVVLAVVDNNLGSNSNTDPNNDFLHSSIISNCKYCPNARHSSSSSLRGLSQNPLFLWIRFESRRHRNRFILVLDGVGQGVRMSTFRVHFPTPFIEVAHPQFHSPFLKGCKMSKLIFAAVFLFALATSTAFARPVAVESTQGSGICTICNFLVNYIEKALASNSTEQAIITKLDKVCNFFGPFEPQVRLSRS
jgi:hypothetical protein